MAARVICVAQDGSGDFKTVQEAIDSVPLGNQWRVVIRVSPGVYRQPVYVPKTKNLITLAGLRPEGTVLTWNNTANKIDHHQVCTHPFLSFTVSVENSGGGLNLRFFFQAARVIGTGTFGCGTVIVEGEDFIAENITFENSSPEVKFLKLPVQFSILACSNRRAVYSLLAMNYGVFFFPDCNLDFRCFYFFIL